MDLELSALVEAHVSAPHSPCGGGGSSGSRQGAGFDADQVPGEGWVFVDTVPGSGQVLTHILTLEKQRLDDGASHRLVFDIEGFGVLASQRPGGSEVMTGLDEVLKFSLCDAGEGDYVVVKRGGANKVAHTRLQAMLSKYTEFRTYFQLGPRKSLASFICSKFGWPRTGAVMFFSLKCIC